MVPKEMKVLDEDPLEGMTGEQLEQHAIELTEEFAKERGLILVPRDGRNYGF